MRLLVAVGVTLVVSPLFAESPAVSTCESSFLGQVKAVSAGRLDVLAVQGASAKLHSVKLDDHTAITLAGGKSGKAADLSKDEWLVIQVAPQTQDAEDKEPRAVKIEPATSSAAAKRLAELLPIVSDTTVDIKIVLQGSADAAALHLLGPHIKTKNDAHTLSLNKDEMAGVLRFLAADGFLAAAKNETTQGKAADSPYLQLSVGPLSRQLPLRAQSLDLLAGIRSQLAEKDAAKLDTLLARVRPVAIAKSVTDQLSAEGHARNASSKILFALGDDALEPLQNGGGRNISPYGEAHINRVDLMYTLIDGIAPNQVPVREGFLTDSFKIVVEKNVTQADLAKMGERRGFTTSGKFDAGSDTASYVKLKPGKNLVEVLKSILCDEPTVVTVDLHYFK